LITSFLSDLALSVIHTLGYAGVFVLSLLESAGIPIPSEVVVPFSGFLAVSGQFQLWVVVVVATLGNYIGSVILYWIGKSGGRWILDRYGKYVLIHRADIERGEAWFNRHGVKAVFWGRMLPVVRTFISLPAGVSRMDFKKFSIYTILGALPWNFALAYVGYKAGEHWDALRQYFHIVDIGIVVVAIGFVIWYVLKKRAHAHA
jgi:membrane protein DedA with SNARE-associated domain